MSLKQDVALAKWLVKTGRVEKAQAEAWLKQWKKELQGEASGSWLNWLYTQGHLSKQDALEIKKAHRVELASLAKSASKKASPREAIASKEPSDGDRGMASDVPEVSRSDSATNGGDDSGHLGDADADPLVGSNEDSQAPLPREMTDGEDHEDESGGVDHKDDEDDEGHGEEGAVLPTKKVCTECHGDNDPEAKSCSTCGANLSAKLFLDCVFCGHKEPRTSKSCAHCGCHPQTGHASKRSLSCGSCRAVLKPEQAICISCGHPVPQRQIQLWSKVGGILGVLQLVAMLGSIFWFRGVTMDLSTPERKETAEMVLVDPYAGLPARSLPESIDEWTLQEEHRPILKEALAYEKAKRWSELEGLVLENEDDLGVPGLVLLGQSFFYQNKGQELLSLAKALPQNEGLRRMAQLWRYWQARLVFQEGLRPQAYQILLPVLESGEANAEQYFWGGVMAWNELEREAAAQWFKKAESSKEGPVDANLFLYLMDRHGVEGQNYRTKWLEGRRDKDEAQKILAPYEP